MGNFVWPRRERRRMRGACNVVGKGHAIVQCPTRDYRDKKIQNQAYGLGVKCCFLIEKRARLGAWRIAGDCVFIGMRYKCITWIMYE